jgi:TusA-related sulfurtransferase
MEGRKNLNLLDVAEPICLLLCKRAIETMRRGEVLDVFISDPEAAENLVKVVARSRDEVLALNRRGDHFHIEIMKGR